MLNKLFLICALGAFWGCSGTDSEDSRSEPSGEKETDDFEKAVPPTPITGINLALDCKLIKANQDKGTYQVGCNLQYEGKTINPDLVSKDYRWTYKVASNLKDVAVLEVSGDYQAIYTFGANSYVKIQEIQNTDLEFRFKPEDTDKEEVVTQRIDKIIAGLANQTHFKFVMKSILKADPTKDLDFINEIEVKVDGQWLTILRNEFGQLRFEDNTPILSNGTINDTLLFGSIYGLLDFQLTPEDLERYSNQAPYDATEPLYLEYTFGRTVSVSGIRYNGGESFLNKNLPTGFPDSIHFEVSGDGQNWTIVEGSMIDVDRDSGQDILEFLFNGADY